MTEPPSRELAWIDGFRGYSVLYSCVMHLVLAFITPRNVAQGVVAVFFVLGGYVSARKPLRAMVYEDDRTRTNLLQNLSGSAFRRVFRIYLPSSIAMLVSTVFSHYGAFDTVRSLCDIRARNDYFPGYMAPTAPKRLQRLDEQLWYCFKDIFNMLNIWPVEQYQPRHNTYLWSMREEYRSSLQLYLAMLICVRLRPHIRLTALVILGQFHGICGRWEVMLYFIGAAAAQAELTGYTKDSVTQPREVSTVKRPNFTTSALLWPILAYSVFQLGFYTVHDLEFRHARPKPTGLIYILERLIPSSYPHRDKFYNGIGCLIVLYAMSDPRIRRFGNKFFVNRFALYLGRNFFGIVLTQNIVLLSGGYLLPHAIWNWLDTTIAAKFPDLMLQLSPEWRIRIGLVGALLILVPIMIVIGDLFTRTVINPCMKFVFVLEGMCSSPLSQQDPGNQAQNKSWRMSPAGGELAKSSGDTGNSP